MTLCALKLLLEPTQLGIQILDGQSRICNWLHNHLLQQANELKTACIKTNNKEGLKTVYSKRGLRNLIPKAKAEHPFLCVVHSSPLKNVGLRLSESIQRHQKSKKTKRLVGWPKFKSWKEGWYSLLYDEPRKGFKVKEDNLIISLGMGKDKEERSLIIPICEAHTLKSKQIKTLRIIKELDQYYAIFTLKKEVPKTKAIHKAIALDPNHKNLAYGVDNEGKAIEVTSPTWLKTYDKRIDELKAKRDRCKKKSKKCIVLDDKGQPTGKEYYLPSKQWKKYDQTLKRALRKRRDQTKTFMYTTAHVFYREYDCVAIGDYTPDGSGDTKQMRRAMNNRSLIGRFKEILSWVAMKSGKTFHEYDEKGTTRTCRHCTYSEPNGIDPSIRMWCCQECEAVHHRDENAAINGLGKALQDVLEKSGTLVPIVSCSDLVVKQRWAFCVSPSGVIMTLQGQNGEKIHSTRKLNRRHDSLRSKSCSLDQL